MVTIVKQEFIKLDEYNKKASKKIKGNYFIDYLYAKKKSITIYDKYDEILILINENLYIKTCLEIDTHTFLIKINKLVDYLCTIKPSLMSPRMIDPYTEVYIYVIEYTNGSIMYGNLLCNENFICLRILNVAKYLKENIKELEIITKFTDKIIILKGINHHLIEMCKFLNLKYYEENQSRYNIYQFLEETVDEITFKERLKDYCELIIKYKDSMSYVFYDILNELFNNKKYDPVIQIIWTYYTDNDFIYINN